MRATDRGTWSLRYQRFGAVWCWWVWVMCASLGVPYTCELGGSAQVGQAGQAVLDGLELDGVQIESAVRLVRT